MANDSPSKDPRAIQMRQRLLLDIDEMTRKPYPNIHLHVGDDLDHMCLVLSPPGWKPMHLFIESLQEFPMHPPTIRMDSEVYHPNVFGGYICATILNDSRYYTPAYTLQGIAIQLLSFFGSDKIEQDYGGVSVDLKEYRGMKQNFSYSGPFVGCERCGFKIGEGSTQVNKLGNSRNRDASGAMQFHRHNTETSAPALATFNRWSQLEAAANHHPSDSTEADEEEEEEEEGNEDGPFAINGLPNEILLQILEELDDFEDLTSLARAWPRVSALIAEHDVVRQRELQCFVTKKTYRDPGVKLGVGVSTDHRGGELASEFDLVSQQAFALGTRASVQNIPFARWLPLPISHRHWDAVRHNAKASLQRLKEHVKLQNPTNAQVLYSFMNDIVVKLNLVNADDNKNDNNNNGYYNSFNSSASTLRHASEKAIESYFHLFHLLVCLATENPEIVTQANALINNFLKGNRDKSHCPNLGHLLVALLVSDVPVTDELRRAIIKEAITRNVVWLLNPVNSRGRGNDSNKKSYPELAYLEPDEVSAYRLDKTFQGSRTSYRLLMFSELFRRTARPYTATTRGSNSPNPAPATLAETRDALFRRHGAPPPGAAARLASEVRRLHTINDFPAFMREMGLSPSQIPNAAQFTAILRKTVHASVQQGYSRWTLPQTDALALRLRRECEPTVGIPKVLAEMVREAPHLPRVSLQGVSFFPDRDNGGRRGSPRARGGRGGSSRNGSATPPSPPSPPVQGVAWPRRGDADTTTTATPNTFAALSEQPDVPSSPTPAAGAGRSNNAQRSNRGGGGGGRLYQAPKRGGHRRGGM
ncbi:SUMO-conjugating enzyme ubc9 [Apiospora arundinis]|uniref:SUMO-conjugating enzyme ubc9 n=1 Tax=Apiospora arundinis TaxID=335852 RepID=A0ABR2JKU9_9PEZI